MKSAHVFPRSTSAEMPVAASGEGPFIVDRSGKTYLDACGGAAVSCLGHSNQAVIEAIKSQLDQIPFAHTGFFTSEAAEELADLLVARAPEGIGRVYFVSGGSEATEAAIKLARQYHLERGQTERRNVIARWQSYHGNTLGALSAGGNRWRRAQYEPLLVGAMHHISACHAWRWKQTGESDFDYGQRVANELETKILELGPETVAAFMAEPVVGATMGAVPAVEGYFKRIREICDAYGVLLILDEVMCGMGRTGTVFACDQDQVRPDMVAIAKGLGAGYQPIGALLVSNDIYAAIADGSGMFQHGHTYIGHPAACAAGAAVLKEFDRLDLMTNVRRQGQALTDLLKARFGNHPHVGDIRGRGLFIGLEFVADRGTKESFDPSLKLHAKIKSAAMEAGLMCYPTGGSIDGQRGDHVLIAPPFIIEEEHLAMIVDRLDMAVAGAVDQARAA